jgi:hypothetical protein
MQKAFGLLIPFLMIEDDEDHLIEDDVDPLVLSKVLTVGIHVPSKKPRLLSPKNIWPNFARQQI